jgi:uncharacterized protein YndB with AHSA1/START domain
MTHFSISIEISAAPARVWSVMSDVERWPDWTPSVTRVEHLEAGPLRIGSRARIKQPKLLAAVWEVTRLEPGKSFTWVTRSPGVRVTGFHAVEPTNTGSRATLSIDFAGLLASFVAWLTRNLNSRYLNYEANGLKKRSEEAD